MRNFITFRNCESVEEGIEKYVLNPQSYLYEEPYFLLQNEVSEIGSCFSLGFSKGLEDEAARNPNVILIDNFTP